jgi:hypothetical protein
MSLDGRLDEVAIWNRALSNDEIAYLYNAGLGNPVMQSAAAINNQRNATSSR